MVRELAPLIGYVCVYSFGCRFLTLSRLSRERRCDADRRVGARRANHAAKAVSNEWRNARPPRALALLSIHRGSARPAGSLLIGDYTTSHAPERAGDAGIWHERTSRAGLMKEVEDRERRAELRVNMHAAVESAAEKIWGAGVLMRNDVRLNRR
jgi:hypothetical protein